MAIQSSAKTENNYTLRLSNKSPGVWNWRFSCLLSCRFPSLRSSCVIIDELTKKMMTGMTKTHYTLCDDCMHCEPDNFASRQSTLPFSSTQSAERCAVVTLQCSNDELSRQRIQQSYECERCLRPILHAEFCVCFLTQRSALIVYQPPSCFRSILKTRLFHLGTDRACVRACVCVRASVPRCVCVNRL